MSEPTVRSAEPCLQGAPCGGGFCPPWFVAGPFGGRNPQFLEEAGGGAAGPVISHSHDGFFLPHSASVYGLSHTACCSFTQLITRKQSWASGAAHGGSFGGEAASRGVNSSEAAGRIRVLQDNQGFGWRFDFLTGVCEAQGELV